MLNYEELKDVSRMNSNSLNISLSEINKLRRPVSLSDSFAFSTQNVERAMSFRSREQIIPLTQEIRNNHWDFYADLFLRFLFHICLISIFETIFFFHYVSTLEDKGIVSTIQTFSNVLIDSCENIPISEQTYINLYIGPYVNSSYIKQEGVEMYNLRLFKNNQLFIRSWLYVGAIGITFIVFYCISILLKLKINIKILVLENIGFVTMLALYELMFFSTIIMPYSPISPQEILQNTIQSLESQCGLF